MRSRILLLVLLVSAVTTTVAQPAWVKKASKSVFTLKTFNAEGTLIGSSTGFYVGENGEAISNFAPFVGATRAVVIDANGKEASVACILGANDTYDVARFRVDTKKTQPLTIAATATPVDVTVWLLPYRETKSPVKGQVTKAETFNTDYTYYTLAMQMPEGTVGAPLFNDEGLVTGVMQQPSTASTGEHLQAAPCYAVSARYADSLRITGLSINDQTLQSTLIKKALPDKASEALLTLYVAGAKLDSVAYAALINDFIDQFPNNADGYIYRAQLATNGSHYDDADRDMAQALKVSDTPDDVHYSYSRLIHQKLLTREESVYPAWSFEKAISEAEAAYAISPMPAYLHQKAMVLYAKKAFDDAYQIYQQLFNTPLRSASLFYEASQCMEMKGDTVTRIALLDSCLAQFTKPYLKEAAPYILVAAEAKRDAGKYREAVTLLNDYEQLMVAQVNDRFYYMRYQAEVAARLFQQALNDITKAIEMKPNEEMYYAEKASLQVRVGQYDDAMTTAAECIRIAPDLSDGYLFLGLAQCLKGQKADGIKNLEKAKELGDPQADGLIEKYAK